MCCDCVVFFVVFLSLGLLLRYPTGASCWSSTAARGGVQMTSEFIIVNNYKQTNKQTNKQTLFCLCVLFVLFVCLFVCFVCLFVCLFVCWFCLFMIFMLFFPDCFIRKHIKYMLYSYICIFHFFSYFVYLFHHFLFIVYYLLFSYLLFADLLDFKY